VSAFELGSDGPGTLVVGLDGSETAWRALHWAVGHARRQGSRVIAVYAERGPVLVDAPVVIDSPAVAEADARYRETLRAGVAELGRETGVDTRFVTVTADPVLALTQVAAEVRADAVVVGASEQAGHRWFGSVALRMVKTGDRPVTVVP
jgi:nucleotide-binding universal stress UspA family protein